MKNLKVLCGALALTMLGACSDRDLAVNDYAPEKTGTQSVAGYVAVEIKLPQEAPTRAEDDGALNDRYADGTPAEYQVDNALIALFIGDKGGDERDAVFYRAQNLPKNSFYNLPTDDPITASYIAAIGVPAPQETKTLYALVILNRNEVSTSITTDEDGNTTFTLADKEVVSNSTTFGTILEDFITENSFIGNDGKSKFFMINAPMSTKPAGETPDPDKGEITYLVNLGNKVYDTPEQAKEKVSGCVYVERAVAKVTCKALEQSALQLTFMDEDGNEIDLTKNGWSVSATMKYALSNTSKKSYVLRNVDFAADNHFGWDYAVNGRARFLGNTPVPALNSPFHDKVRNLYRIYWCRDPHYDVAMQSGQKNVITMSKEFKTVDNTLYCKENTFQVKHQNYNSSTLAFFEVNFTIMKGSTEYKDLYVRDGNNHKVYLSMTSAYADGITRIIRNVSVQNAIAAAVVSGKSLPQDFSIKDHLDINIVPKANKDGEKHLVIEDVTLKFDPATEDYFDAESINKFNTTLAPAKKDLLDGVNALSDIVVYEGGICYYATPIKHFGDYYTPWDKEKNKGLTTSEVYNKGADNWDNTDHAQKYLGRYGMVRNNWYELNVSKIAALGDAVIPDSNMDLADDNNEDKKYFAVDIHIMSWAKRIQDIQF